MADIVNHITFGTDDASLAAFCFMLHEVRAEGQPLGSIDFNKLIPMPQEPAALAQAMSAGIWRFQAEMERPNQNAHNGQKKNDHRRVER